MTSGSIFAKISRRHCCVALAYDRIFVRDLGSHNGVRVNGRVVEEALLQAGDEVAIGPLIYRWSPIPQLHRLPLPHNASRGGNTETCWSRRRWVCSRPPGLAQAIRRH